MTMKFSRHRSRCVFFLTLLAAVWAVPAFVLAQATAPGGATNAPATNAPSVSALWTPTDEQRELERGGRFQTLPDPEHGQVHFRVLNITPPNPKEGSACNLTRSVLSGGRSAYAFEVVVTRPISQPALFFDSLKPVVFVVDGERFACPTYAAQTQCEKSQGPGAVSWRSYYGGKATEQLVRALGRAKEASVAVPCKGGTAWERKFGPDDLGRLATFVRVYLPQP